MCTLVICLFLAFLSPLATAQALTLYAPNGSPITIGSPLADVRKALGAPRFADTVISLRQVILMYADGLHITSVDNHVTAIIPGTRAQRQDDGSYRLPAPSSKPKPQPIIKAQSMPQPEERQSTRKVSKPLSSASEEADAAYKAQLLAKVLAPLPHGPQGIKAKEPLPSRFT